jgi:hypothetical protein
MPTEVESESAAWNSVAVERLKTCQWEHKSARNEARINWALMLFVVTPTLLVLGAAELCFESAAWRNSLGWFFGLGVHALLLIICWFVVISCLQDDVSTKWTCGIALGVVDTVVSIYSFGLAVTAILGT